MPGSAGTGGSQDPQATSIRSDTELGKGLGPAVFPRIHRDFCQRAGEGKEERDSLTTASLLPLACLGQNRSGGFH